MKKILGLLIVLISISFTACGGGSSREPRVVNYTPDLHRFDMVDSYGIDTAQPGTTPLVLSPYLYNGLFDVFWEVNSLEDYRMNIRLNDSSGIHNSLLIYSEICGVNRACDQDGSVICEYTSDFRLSCNNSNHPEDIKPLFPNGAPQNLYLILEVCDMNSSYCAYDYYPVRME
ncbi:MAG: hypothetical protein V4732_00990 [Pseudomonadota bacterium]